MLKLRFRIDLIFVAAISSMLLIASCKKSSIDPIGIDQSYFPLSTGKYITYDVDSVGYNNFYTASEPEYVTHSIYQIKEQVDSPYIDNTGNTAYKIIRYRRENDSSSWIAIDAWSANLTETTAEKVEENLRFIKLDFPIVLDRQWYGNSYIQTDSPYEWLEGWRYEYTEIHQPLTIGALSFDSTLTVTQEDDVNAILQTVFTEKYARNVGMIYKYEKRLETQPYDDPDGYIIEMIIREFN